MKLKNKIIVSMLAISLLMLNNHSSLAMNYRNFEKQGYDIPSAIVIDEKSGDILYAQNENEVRPIASLSKTMTFLLVLEAIERGQVKEDEVVELVNDPNSWGSSFYLKKGDKYTIDELLRMVMVISANDACIVLAEKISGSVDEFVSNMNNRAKELGLKDTTFYNPNGLPILEGEYKGKSNTSTAKDLAVLTKYIMNAYKDNALKYVSRETLGVNEELGVRYNTNKLLLRNSQFEGFRVDGFKTGFTDEARFCLITTSQHDNGTPDIEEDDYRTIAVNLGSDKNEPRFVNHAKMLSYVNETYKNKKILDGNSLEGTINEFKDDKHKISVIPSKSVYTLMNVNDNSTFEKSVEYNKDIKYPVAAGDIVGVMTLKNSKHPELNTQVELVSANSTQSVTLFEKLFKTSK